MALTRVFTIALLVLGMLSLLACQGRPSYREGGLYSVPAEAGKYSIVKILKTDGGGVHLRIYSNLFPSRPTAVDESKLYMAGMDHKPHELLGMGHSPISYESFRQWQPELIKVVPVQPDELEGYRMWLDAKGGYF